MTQSTKNTLWIILWVIILWGISLYAYYSYTLQQSKKTAAAIPNRAVVQERIPEEVIAEYKKEQEVMRNEQQIIEKEMEESEEIAPLGQWSFNRLDLTHRAEWSVTVTAQWDDVFIILDESFKTGNGPDLYVLLTTSPETYEEDQSLNLWPLTSIQWKQVYKVSMKEWEQYWWSVMIWCRAFDVIFSVATF